MNIETKDPINEEIKPVVWIESDDDVSDGPVFWCAELGKWLKQQLDEDVIMDAESYIRECFELSNSAKYIKKLEQRIKELRSEQKITAEQLIDAVLAGIEHGKSIMAYYQLNGLISAPLTPEAFAKEYVKKGKAYLLNSEQGGYKQ